MLSRQVKPKLPYEAPEDPKPKKAHPKCALCGHLADHPNTNQHDFHLEEIHGTACNAQNEHVAALIAQADRAGLRSWQSSRSSHAGYLFRSPRRRDTTWPAKGTSPFLASRGGRCRRSSNRRWPVQVRRILCQYLILPVRWFVLLLAAHFGLPALAKTSAATWFEWAKLLSVGASGVTMLQYPAALSGRKPGSRESTMQHVNPAAVRKKKDGAAAPKRTATEIDESSEGEDGSEGEEGRPSKLSSWAAGPSSFAPLPSRQERDVDVNTLMTFERVVRTRLSLGSLTASPQVAFKRTADLYTILRELSAAQLLHTDPGTLEWSTLHVWHGRALHLASRSV